MECFAEFLPFINSCNVFVKFENSVNIEHIKISENEFALNLSDATTIKLASCPGITFQPFDLDKPSKNGDWFSFRVLLNKKSRVINTILSEVSNELRGLNINESLEDSLAKKYIKIICTHCGLPISDEFSFGRVLPLPSVDWDAASEDWFCHLHSSHKKLLKESSLVPKLNDCFFNEIAFCFNANIVKDDYIKDQNVVCSKCKNIIGIVTDHKVKVWSSDVKLVSKEFVFHNKTPKDVVLLLLKNLEKDSFGINPRLVLQEGKGDQMRYLCLYPIDTSMELLVYNSIEQKFLSKLDQNSKKTKPNDECRNQTLRKVKTVKILYKYKDGPDDESSNWIDDINFHVIPCGNYLFENMFNILKTSNEELPTQLKTARDLNIGYILI